MSKYIQPDLFAFFRDLSENNERPWFAENKERFESSVREPLLQFIREFEPHLKGISPHYDAVAKKTGGSLFRIYRDVRFGKDKRPYKTQAGLHFRHEQAKDAYAPGFYLHLEPGNIFMGAGVWRPPSPSLKLIRGAIDKDQTRWLDVSRDTNVLTDYKLSEGDRLKRPPRGFDKSHPLIEDLKRKSFIFIRSFSEEEVMDDAFMHRFTDECKRLSPFMDFIATALGLPF